MSKLFDDVTVDRICPRVAVPRYAVIEPCEKISGFDGTTMVDFQVVAGDELSIDKVFNDGMPSVDLWLENHEVDDNTVHLKVREIVSGTNARYFGAEMRNVIENIVDNEHKRVIVDFAGVEMCSSAFVDELVGKLLMKYQFIAFNSLLEFRNVNAINSLLINHSIIQRMQGSRIA